MKGFRKPCVVSGCPELVEHGRCPQHQRQRDRSADARRPSAARRGYGARWDAARRAYLAQHPLCECDECRRTGELKASSVVDHIIAHRGDPRLFWDQSNWCAMSKTCHDRKTSRQDGGFGRRRVDGGEGVSNRYGSGAETVRGGRFDPAQVPGLFLSGWDAPPKGEG
jgi:5-methylcytosine-specific restriction protein A